ncbi:maltose/maltodextrin ABC transporter substrate binding periplasmic protein MalE [Vibrio variabilis]|uniref:Maltose/maltodextrin ABC transporter substrate binding periplasmic protein MalE n=1 Tax=Vibrio variabilis TaxID=990271 RepID=A0ABQ0JES8_9VIBR|nr:maltose/maltodextrin ABC transporter substrate binding periplasmic protein MalE [Vibrio variabilis]
MVSIYNRSVERAKALAKQYQIPAVYDSVSELVANAPEDAIYDLALMPAQFIPVLEQLPDGASVLIQKPMGDDYEQARQIQQLCERKGLKASINCQLRYAPFVLAARDLISKGAIGDIYDMEVRVTVHTPWEYFPNVINHPRLEIQQHSVHYVDLVRSFLGNPQRVLAKTVAHPLKPMSSTRTTMIMDYGNQLRAVINTNHDHEFGLKNQDSFIKWEGTKGAIIARLGLLMNYPDGCNDEFEYCTFNDEGVPVWHTIPLKGSWFPEAFIGTMADNQRYTVGEITELPSSVDDVLDTMQCVEQAYAVSGETV